VPFAKLFPLGHDDSVRVRAEVEEVERKQVVAEIAEKIEQAWAATTIVSTCGFIGEPGTAPPEVSTYIECPSTNPTLVETLYGPWRSYLESLLTAEEIARKHHSSSHPRLNLKNKERDAEMDAIVRAVTAPGTDPMDSLFHHPVSTPTRRDREIALMTVMIGLHDNLEARERLLAGEKAILRHVLMHRLPIGSEMITSCLNAFARVAEESGCSKPYTCARFGQLPDHVQANIHTMARIGGQAEPSPADTVFATNWENALDLVGSRAVWVYQGAAFFRETEARLLIHTLASERMDRQYGNQADEFVDACRSVCEIDDRFMQIQKAVSRHYSRVIWEKKCARRRLTNPVDLPPLGSERFEKALPLCMRGMHSRIQSKTGHLHHSERLAFSRFLLHAGCEQDEILEFWRPAFERSDQGFEKNWKSVEASVRDYATNPRHFGRDSDRVLSYTCDKMAELNLCPHARGPLEDIEDTPRGLCTIEMADRLGVFPSADITGPLSYTYRAVKVEKSPFS